MLTLIKFSRKWLIFYFFDLVILRTAFAMLDKLYSTYKKERIKMNFNDYIAFYNKLAK